MERHKDEVVRTDCGGMHI